MVKTNALFLGPNPKNETLYKGKLGRRGGLMVSALDFGSNGPDSSRGRSTALPWPGNTSLAVRN